jgi:hypothetical protein
MQNHCGYSWFGFDTADDRFNYGGNIYKDYDEKLIHLMLKVGRE